LRASEIASFPHTHFGQTQAALELVVVVLMQIDMGENLATTVSSIHACTILESASSLPESYRPSAPLGFFDMPRARADKRLHNK
jgi:hypothetical protein